MKYELTKDLETGNAVIDSEHRQLFQAVNSLLDACAQGKGRTQMKPACDFLLNYVDKHFKNEENIQIKSAYPGYNAHRQFHESYKMQLKQIAKELENEGASVAGLSKFNQAVSILVNHIRMEDRKLAQHVKQS